MVTMVMCGADQFLDQASQLCQQCAEVCDPLFPAPEQCMRECADFALREGYLHIGPCTIMQNNYSPLIIFPILSLLLVIIALLFTFLEARFHTWERCMGSCKGESASKQMDGQTDLLTNAAVVIW